jgi:carbon-monoxide dehydrogenase small subunit
MILSAKTLLDQNSKPTEQEIIQYMNGNICRCTGYKKIVESIAAAAKKMRKAA